MNWDILSAVSGLLAVVLSLIVNWPVLKHRVTNRAVEETSPKKTETADISISAHSDSKSPSHSLKAPARQYRKP